MFVSACVCVCLYLYLGVFVFAQLLSLDYRFNLLRGFTPMKSSITFRPFVHPPYREEVQQQNLLHYLGVTYPLTHTHMQTHILM